MGEQPAIATSDGQSQAPNLFSDYVSPHYNIQRKRSVKEFVEDQMRHVQRVENKKEGLMEQKDRDERQERSLGREV